MRFFKKSDIIIIAVLLVLCLVFYFTYDYLSKDNHVKAEIYYFSELIDTVELNNGRETTFAIDINPNVILKIDRDGGIAFIDSDCPDKVCIKTGRLSRVGEYAACLPNGIIVKIVSAGERDDDADIIIKN